MPGYVRDWMQSPVVVIDPDSSVSYAMTLMRRRRIHSLVVDLSREGGGYGIVTTTDISSKIVAADANPAELTVRDIMSAPVVTGKPDWTLKEASLLMQKHRFHHLPIEENGELVGIISDTDIFMAVEEIGWKR
ncbi:MAG: CBS domain-containing protein [Anaerolineales bacterium]|nr:CBS domain-containing protein [Anaerolineales bacterium]MCX7754948.1 CBS domain-containing protein [Anaerolineales bacterium]MDW8277326.1 CBS domain-containing protein [Anaerolineales bacterium]